jgi:hypothetical protein
MKTATHMRRGGACDGRQDVLEDQAADVGAEPDRGTGAGDLSPRRGSHRVCLAGIGEALGGCRAILDGSHTRYALGHDPDFPETHGEARKTSGTQARSRRRSPRRASESDGVQGASRERVPRLRWIARALPPDAPATDSRYSRGHSCRNHAAHDPSRLVPDLPPACGRRRGRCAAGQRGWQSHVGAFGLVALRIGAHDAADRGRAELSLGIESVARRPDEDVDAG